MSKNTSTEESGDLSLTGRLVFMAAAMFGFGFLLVPLYDVFCEITGFGGKTNDVAATVEESIDQNRTIGLGFVTTVNGHAPWEFEPAVDSMTIHPGGIYEAMFFARNLTGQRKTAQAVPSVAPSEAAKYFKKLECFCFSEQEFAPGEAREMPVRFIVESSLPDYIDTITLSYTFFDTARQTDASMAAIPAVH